MNPLARYSLNGSLAAISILRSLPLRFDTSFDMLLL
jgi:hypothetical protein